MEPTGRHAAPRTRCNKRLSRLDKVASGSYLFIMRSVGLKILKNKLSEYIRLVVSGEIVLQLIRRAADEFGAAVVMATHSAEAAAIADVRVRMRDGQIESKD